VKPGSNKLLYNTFMTKRLIQTRFFQRLLEIIVPISSWFLVTLPLWLSPIQIRVINFTDRNTKACEKLVKELKELIPNIRIDTDLASVPLSGKIRDAEMQKINYIIVIGDKEEKSSVAKGLLWGSQIPPKRVRKHNRHNHIQGYSCIVHLDRKTPYCRFNQEQRQRAKLPESV